MTDKNSRCHTRAQSSNAQTKQNCGMWEVPTFVCLLHAEEPYNFGLKIGVNTKVTKLLCSNPSQLALSSPSLPVQVEAPVPYDQSEMLMQKNPKISIVSHQKVSLAALRQTGVPSLQLASTISNTWNPIA